MHSVSFSKRKLSDCRDVPFLFLLYCICDYRCILYRKLCTAFMWSKRSNPIISSSLFSSTAPVSALLHSVTESFVFRFESIHGDVLSVSSPSCLHEKPWNSRIWKGEATMQRCHVLKVKLSGCSALFSVLAAAQKAWRSLLGLSPVADLWRIAVDPESSALFCCLTFLMLSWLLCISSWVVQSLDPDQLWNAFDTLLAVLNIL